MRNLVVCCDGTWQDPSARSNVSRLCELLDPPVVKQHVKGVGTGDLVNRATTVVRSPYASADRATSTTGDRAD
jgi:uncharacterized protein (DUF2235 family)